MRPADDRVVVLGGGLAAARVAEGLRDLGHRGEVVLVSEEQEAPYDRPPLSKDALGDDFDPTSLHLLRPEGYAEQGIELLLGRRAVGLDLDARRVRLDTGDALAYDRLVVATGSRARRLPTVADAPDVHYLRTADDSRRLAAALQPGASLAVVGAGFIGLEVAATAAARGCRTTVVEAAPAPLVAALGPLLSAWLVRWHTAQGTTLLTGVTVTAEGSDRTGRLVLSDGTAVDADAVLVGVGITRDVDWLAEAGLAVHVGVVVDAAGRTNHPDVFAAGDVVCLHRGDACAPVGHWTAAADSGARVARTLCGMEQEPVQDDAFFWSTQGALRLQSVGRWSPEATTEVVSGSLDEGRFVAHHTVDGRLVGVAGVNDPRGFLAGRRQLLAAGVPA